MKKLILSICTLLTCCAIAHTQCPPGDVLLTTQQEVDDFVANYPNCTSTNGSLRILTNSNTNPIISLNGLNQLTSVEGILEISNNDSLTDLNNSFNQLTSVGTLIIRNNASMTSLAGLNQLTSIASGAVIENNSSLTSLNGLNELTSAGWNLQINSNNLLTDLSGLNKLTFIGGGCLIWFNDSLTDLNGLNQLTSIGGRLDIENNDLMTSLNGIEQLTSIGGNLEIASNDALIDMSGLSQLTSVGEDLNISNNDLLTNFNGLNNLTNIEGSVSIGNHAILDDIAGLENVGTMSSLSIFNNPNLSFCSITSVCNHIEGVSYTVINSNNAAGCNSQAEVLENCALLPIEMVNPLQIRLKNHTALLSWRTETETNNSGFEIQRSHDGINWQRIGWQAGQGTTTSRHTYTHADENPLVGVSYYRLKQVDFDGQFSYSNAVSLRYTRPQLEVFPNPVKDKLYILTNETTIDKVLIFNTMGQQINVEFEGDTIDVSLLPVGLYTVKVSIEGEDFYEKIVIE